MSKKTFFLFLFLVLLSLKNFATHIVGGEIYYDYKGSNNYKITLKVYRDCYNGIPQLDNPAYVFIFNSSGVFIDSLAMPLYSSAILPSGVNNPCFVPPTNVCVQEGIYYADVKLLPAAGGYYLSYQRCCRNSTILNLINPGNVGSTYMAHIPDPSIVQGNSSPRFKNFPPIFICSNVPLTFDHSASDPDGDSLYYDFCDPYDGASAACPVFGPNGDPNCPEIGDPPPYRFVPWLAPYSASYPMGSLPVMTVDPVTGLMTGTPNIIGQWVVGVCVSEYRNGVLLDVNKRDFQFNVTNCPNLPVASVPVQNRFCFGYQVNFTQNSVNAFSYNWDFGDPTTNADVSTNASPSWIYPDSGTYTVTLIINQGSLCADTSTTVFHIQQLLAPSFTPPPGECVENNSFNFTASGDYQGTGTFFWDFGNRASPPTASVKNPVNIVFDTAGTFPVTLIIKENGCTSRYTADVTVYPKPKAYYGLAAPIACELQPVHFIDSSSADTPLNYQWLFGDGGTSAMSDPYHAYMAVGSYQTSLMITTTHGCADTFALPLATAVYPTPTAGFSVNPADTSIFYPDITMTDKSIGAWTCIANWGDGSVYSICDSMHHYTSPGTYNIMQVVTNTAGCTDTAYSEVLIRPEFLFWIPNAFTPNSSDGLNDVFKPVLIGVHAYTLLIFDRWGEKIFESQNSDEGWNGYYQGRLCSNDVYVYKINFRDDVKNSSHEYIGKVTLVR